MFPKATQLKRLRVWIGLIFLLAGISALGSTNSDWFTRAWQIDDGLLDNDINGIVQGPDGYLWLLTPAGLMRFDGVTFSPFAIEDFSGPSIRFLLCSRTGVVWLASDGGKIIGLNSDFSTVSLANKSLPERMPIALASDDKGVLWLGYHDVICRVQDGQVEKFGAKDGVPPGTLSTNSCTPCTPVGSTVPNAKTGAWPTVGTDGVVPVIGVQGQNLCPTLRMRPAMQPRLYWKRLIV